ncbi:DUF2177 family protein [Ancylobacter lacus]|uniref:DUF2177 family protein n=1 Tax=Ancylobacter lacus TaxID=2579970 RepID=UPI001BCDDB72|nr:DUF2177 family protein [Ancylobacter lacus]MBS7539510.1 DUF2177 family protein [Ancylobacter lacus]
MIAYGIAYLVTGLVFLGLDAVWLGTMTGLLYRPLLGHLLASEVDLAAAAAFYLLYIAGVVLFAVHPGLENGRATTSLLLGAALGLLAYGTYDLTNQATLRDWPLAVTLADLCWGSFVTGCAAMAGQFAASATQRWATGA